MAAFEDGLTLWPVLFASVASRCGSERISKLYFYFEWAATLARLCRSRGVGRACCRHGFLVLCRDGEPAEVSNRSLALESA